MFAGFQATNFEKLGGLYNFLFVEDVPDGFSPALQNVRFKPGAVESRPGIGSGAWSKPPVGLTSTSFYGLSQFIDNLGNQHNLTLDQLANLDQQAGAGVVSVYGGIALPGSRLSTTNLNNRQYMAFYQPGVLPGGSIVSLDSQGNLDPVSPLGPATKDHLESTGQIVGGSNQVTNVTQIQTWCIGDLIGDSQNAIVGPGAVTSTASVIAVDYVNSILTLSQNAVKSSNLGNDGISATLFYPLVYVQDDVLNGQVVSGSVTTAGTTYSVGDVLSGVPGTIGPIKGYALNAGGTSWNLGDAFTVNNALDGAVLATGTVTSTNGLGVATAISLLTFGAKYGTGSGVATTATTGSGTGLTINITSISPGDAGGTIVVTVTSVGGGGAISGYVASFAGTYGWYPTVIALSGGHGSGANFTISQVADSTYVSGNISEGLHAVAVSFRTRSGYYTEPCALCFWQAAGNRRVTVNYQNAQFSLVGADNPCYTAISFMFTQANDLHIYQIPSSIVGIGPSTVSTFNFFDTDLTGGDLQDQLYDNQRLSDQAGLTQYNSRLVVWGGLATIRLAGLDFLGLTTATSSVGIIGGITLGSGGSGWAAGNTFVVNPEGLPGLSPAQGTVNTVSGGAVATFTITNTGGPYYSAPTTVTATATSGTGIGLTFNITGVVASTITVPYGWNPGADNRGAVQTISTLSADVPGARPGIFIGGDGTSSTIGEIQQSEAALAIQPNTSYTVQIWLKQTGGWNPTFPPGGLTITLMGTGVGAHGITAGVLIPAGTITTAWQLFTGVLCSATEIPVGSGPNQVTPDLRLRLALFGTPPVGQGVYIARMQIYPTATPYEASVVRFSDPFNADRFDDISGFQQVTKDDGQRVTSCEQLRWYFYINKERSMHVTFDDGQNPPSLWTSNLVDSSVGAGGPNAMLATESFIITAARPGAYIFFGGKPTKLSQEIQTTWESINWAAASTIHVALDPQLHIVYFFVPLGSATVPNTALILDYTEGLGQEDEPGGRKWGYDALPVNVYASLIGESPTHTQSVWFAGTSVESPGTAKVYLQGNEGDLDDGVIVDAFYETSYARAAPNGTSLFGGLAYTVAGSGTLLNSLLPLGSQAGDTNEVPLRPQTLLLPLNADVEVYANLESERARARFETNGLQNDGTCDYFQVRRVGIFAMPWAPQRPH